MGSPFTASTSFTIIRIRPPMSTSVTLTAGPVAASKTRRQGSALPPMSSGWTSNDGLPAAIEGQTSSMCAPTIRAWPAGRTA